MPMNIDHRNKYIAELTRSVQQHRISDIEAHERLAEYDSRSAFFYKDGAPSITVGGVLLKYRPLLLLLDEEA
jgi:hypothetical protein